MLYVYLYNIMLLHAVYVVRVNIESVLYFKTVPFVAIFTLNTEAQRQVTDKKLLFDFF